MVAQAAAVILDVLLDHHAVANRLAVPVDATADVAVTDVRLHLAAVDLLDATVAVLLDHHAAANQLAAVVDC